MTTDSLEELAQRVRSIARVPRLLLACDYDGTIAPVTGDPRRAYPLAQSVEAMTALASLDDTEVTVISGRSLGDLAALSRLPRQIRLVGSHGSEFDLTFELPRELATLRNRIAVEAETIAERFGIQVELKQTGVVFHLRLLPDEVRRSAREAIVRGPAGWDGVITRNGRQIVELSVVEGNKGRALTRVRDDTDASAVIFVGDDVTDEDAMRTLGPSDVGIKVGPGVTSAAFRVEDPAKVAQILSLLHELRSEWVQGNGLDPIDDYSILSDQRTVALVSRDASINWLCLPRVDSAAVFARLLGTPDDGYFRIGPADGSASVTQGYAGDTMTVVTEFETLTVTDYLDASAARPERLAGRSDLIRRITGRGQVRIEFAPRVDFGRVATRIEVSPDGLTVRGTVDQLVLRAPGIDWTIQPEGGHETAIGTVSVGPDPLILELRSGTSALRPDHQNEPERRTQTDEFWSRWASKLVLPCPPEDPGVDLIRRSALILRGLVHGPTGAIASSATTSLPAHIGGVRNWDQRYCWVRDASMAAESLVSLGSASEADRLVSWLIRVLDDRGRPERLAPLFNVSGRYLQAEAEIAELAGYADSAPVRVGNAAEGQVQMDSYGSVVSLLEAITGRRGAMSDQEWGLCRDMALAVTRRWSEPDHGLWEVRSAPTHHTHSKLMCWVALDRATAMAHRFGRPADESWAHTRDQIAKLILTEGWNTSRGTFVSTLGGDHLDASSLLIGLHGLVSPDDPRFGATVDAIGEELATPAGLHRYLYDDNLPGHDGVFHLATGWMTQALHLIGRTTEAQDMMDRLIRSVGPTGGLSGQYDPDRLMALGNYPMAASHLALINAFVALG